MRDAANVPQLQEYPAAGVVYRVGHGLPAVDLLCAVDAGRPGIALRLGADLHAFTDDQAGVGALGVVLHVQRLRQVAGLGGALAGQRRHDYAVGQIETAQAGRLKQGSAGHGCLPESVISELPMQDIMGVANFLTSTYDLRSHLL